MKYLKDFCALILSNVTLYNGLYENNATVAVYGKNKIAHSLVNFETSFIKNGPENILKLYPHKSLKIHKIPGLYQGTYFCLSKDAGFQGLEKYLYYLGFKKSDYLDETDSTNEFFEEDARKVNSHNRILRDHDSELGRKIGAAITMGCLGLKGTYSCAASEKNKVFYRLHMDFPLNMGLLEMIFSQMSDKVDQRLVYINGNLRVIRRAREGGRTVFNIYPKLDKVENGGLMDRKFLESFLQRQFMNSPNGPELDTYLVGTVYLGGFNHTEILDDSKD